MLCPRHAGLRRGRLRKASRSCLCSLINHATARSVSMAERSFELFTSYNFLSNTPGLPVNRCTHVDTATWTVRCAIAGGSRHPEVEQKGQLDGKRPTR
jgi:hypothetical protein